MTEIEEYLASTGVIPLGWAGSTEKMDYLNFGDALSPVMVALCTGRGVARIPTASKTPRLAAVGTIGHGFKDGKVWFWGSGCSPYLNPSAPSDEKVAYEPPADTEINILATRGKISETLLSGGKGGPGIYGDPVWMLPEYYAPKIEKKWELGVILHLSELTDRALDVHFNDKLERYVVPHAFRDKIHLINTVTSIGIDPMKDKLDEILQCKRLVSTSLHGMVFAESYKIPCLYFAPNGDVQGVDYRKPVLSPSLDARIVDLYSGLGVDRFPVYVQPRTAATDWQHLIDEIDRVWSPVELDTRALRNALPFEVVEPKIPEQGTIFDLPLLRDIRLQHNVSELRKEDAKRNKA